MRGCPQNCTVCEFESSCDSGMYMDGCRFLSSDKKSIHYKSNYHFFEGTI